MLTISISSDLHGFIAMVVMIVNHQILVQMINEAAQELEIYVNAHACFQISDKEGTSKKSGNTLEEYSRIPS